MRQAIHLVLRAQQLADDAFKTLVEHDEDANRAETKLENGCELPWGCGRRIAA